MKGEEVTAGRRMEIAHRVAAMKLGMNPDDPHLREVAGNLRMYFDGQRSSAHDRPYPTVPARTVKDLQIGLLDRHELFPMALEGFYATFIDDVLDRLEEEPEVPRDQIMFYPLDISHPQAPLMLATLIRAQLMRAVTYQVTADMCDAVMGMSQKTAQRVEYLATDDRPSTFGFVWMDKPYASGWVRGTEVPVRAVSWSPQPMKYTTGAEMEGTRFCEWAWADDVAFVIEQDGRTELPEAFVLDEVFRSIGPLVLLHTFVWPHNVRFDMSEQEANHPAVWILALWLMLGSEIVVSRKDHGDRPMRRRAEKARIATDITVVTLRRARHAEDDDSEPGMRDVDWSCRWLVAGHWRHHTAPADRHHAKHVPGPGKPSCAICGGGISWVKPYVKGPDDKPVRIVERVYKLAR